MTDKEFDHNMKYIDHLLCNAKIAYGNGNPILARQLEAEAMYLWAAWEQITAPYSTAP